MSEQENRDIQSRKIIGMPVYSCKEGLYLGNIKNLLVDIRGCLVQGFVVERRRMSKDEKIIPFTAIHSFGDDGITIETATQMERRGQSPQYIRALRHPIAIIGSRVFTTAGRTLGKVEEYRFDHETGDISGLEISPDGFFKVRSLVKGEYIIAITGNTVMLNDIAANDAEEIENVFISNVGNAAETVKEKAGEIINNTADLTRRFSSNISEKMERFKKREEDYLEEEFADDLEPQNQDAEDSDAEAETAAISEEEISAAEDEDAALAETAAAEPCPKKENADNSFAGGQKTATED
jgi:uncharacterized protein YrrD